MPQQPRPDGPPASSTQPAAGTPEYSTPAGDGETTARVLGPAERLATLAHVFTPPLLSGVIDRRPWATALVERLEWDAAGVRTARRLHLRYGPGPLRLWRRGRPSVLALDPRDARRLLDETPDPFTPAAAEKRAALGVFQPHGVLISGWDQRAALRRANETILATARVTHPDAERFTRVISEETSALVGSGDRGRVLDWPLFEDSWWTTVRRLVLGERARDDTVLIEQLKRLRGAGNWGPLGPRRRALRAAFLRRLELHARHAEADCLAARTAELDAVGQIPHWLFAYDAAGMTAMRALTLLAIHPEDATAARAEVAAHPQDPQEWSTLRAAALEAVRLWPTTPLILRESTRETHWADGSRHPSGTLFVIYTPYLHRGQPAGEAQDRFTPSLWSGGEGGAGGTLLPFSSGPAGCPGQNLVLLTVTSWLASVLAEREVRLLSHRLGTDPPTLPVSLDHASLRLQVH